MRIYTVGYGRRGTEELAGLLRRAGVATLVHVRLRPDRARMGRRTATEC